MQYLYGRSSKPSASSHQELELGGGGVQRGEVGLTSRGGAERGGGEDGGERGDTPQRGEGHDGRYDGPGFSDDEQGLARRYPDPHRAGAHVGILKMPYDAHLVEGV